MDHGQHTLRTSWSDDSKNPTCQLHWTPRNRETFRNSYLRRMGSTSSFRGDVEGLRGFAVLAIIVFHINPALLPGGFVGVDVFFVISGFLMTLQVDHRPFSWTGFYSSRAKRILPARAVLLLVNLNLALSMYAGPTVVSVAWATLASLGSASNIWQAYFVESGYFAPETALAPLTHLWSLSTEEQFYVLWPPLFCCCCVSHCDPPRQSALRGLRARLLSVLSVVCGGGMQPNRTTCCQCAYIKCFSGP